MHSADSGFFTGSISMGQTEAHFPHLTHFSSSIYKVNRENLLHKP
jgi:hypothetical protein